MARLGVCNAALTHVARNMSEFLIIYIMSNDGFVGRPDSASSTPTRNWGSQRHEYGVFAESAEKVQIRVAG
jgi:hypothetical protein